MAGTNEVIEHVRRRIAAAVIEDEPFPHFVVNNLLPDATYQQILANWPPPELTHLTNSTTRRELEVASQLHLFPAFMQPTWQQVIDWTAVARALVLEKFMPYLKYKFVPLIGPRRAAKMMLVTRREPAPFLATYTGAFHLPAHVDNFFIVANSYLYVSELDVEEPELGTVLYRSYGLALPDNLIRLPPAVMHRYLRRAKVVPYCGNFLFSYLNTPFAFHGVDATDIGARLRRLLMFGTICDPKTFTAEERHVLAPPRVRGTSNSPSAPKNDDHSC